MVSHFALISLVAFRNGIFALFILVLASLPNWATARMIGHAQDNADKQAFGYKKRGVSSPAAMMPLGLAHYGPFRVLDFKRAALVGVTDAGSPDAFAAMLCDFPQIAMLELVECPGTDDDRANLRLGRMIRQQGIETYVPAHGSVRSGGVELFLAGAQRRIDEGAEFAVHAWIDERGHQAGEFPIDSPAHRSYLEYYKQMGMSVRQAQAFYAMTNSVPYSAARYLSAAEMRGWIPA